MEEEKKPSQRTTNNKDSCGGRNEDGTNEEDDLVFPGFRFHPTDQELVGFYLKRKVEKKRFSIDIIREIDIYKHDPWDLPNEARQIVQGTGDKDCYFFCLRGRKYRNSIRPNRVTGSGFWKATGIDKPIHDGAGDRVGLKKSLVYYRGSAGRGTKTDWMMHEYRLPSTELVELHDAEIWTVCRIFKRSTSYNRRCQQQQKQKQEHGSKRSQQQQQQELQYYYDYYHHNQHYYFYSSETAYDVPTAHQQPFQLRGFHGSSSSSVATTVTVASSEFMGAPLPPPSTSTSTSTSTVGWSHGTSLRESGSTWDELGRIMEI